LPGKIPRILGTHSASYKRTIENFKKAGTKRIALKIKVRTKSFPAGINGEFPSHPHADREPNKRNR
jgi:hypothetical protein